MVAFILFLIVKASVRCLPSRRILDMTASMLPIIGTYLQHSVTTRLGKRRQPIYAPPP